MDKNMLNRERCVKLHDKTVYQHEGVNLDKNVNNCCASVFTHTSSHDTRESCKIGILNNLLREQFFT